MRGKRAVLSLEKKPKGTALKGKQPLKLLQRQQHYLLGMFPGKAVQVAKYHSLQSNTLAEANTGQVMGLLKNVIRNLCIRIFLQQWSNTQNTTRKINTKTEKLRRPLKKSWLTFKQIMKSTIRRKI